MSDLNENNSLDGVPLEYFRGQPKILLVDDEPNNIRLLTASLQHDYDLMIASSPEAALQILQQEVPHLILLDVMMPGMNGFELCRRIKSMERLRNVPVIFITALSDDSSEELGFDLGAVDYIHKPFRLPIVRARIRTHLSLQGMLDHLRELRDELKQRIEEVERIKGRLNDAVSARDLFERVFMSTSEGIMVTNADGDVVAVNQSFARITGYEEAEVLGQNPRLFKSGVHDEAFYDEMWQSIRRDGVWSGEICNRRKDGQRYPELRTISAVYGPDGEITHYVAVFSDISSLKQTQEQIDYLTWHDALTGLPNRLLMLDRLESTIRTCHRNNTITSLLIVDIDHFKAINESHGHVAGDQLLTAFAQRLQGLLAPTTGDIDRASMNASETASRIHAAMQEPIEIEALGDVSIQCTLGIVMLPSAECDSATMALQHADTAHHRAKTEGAATLFFDDEMGRQARMRFELSCELAEAIRRDQLILYVQPQCAPDGTLTGAEALVRWQHPDKGLILPGEFIPVAEQSSLISRLEHWVLRNSLNLIRDIERSGHRVPLSVNISPRHFAEAGFVDEVLELLAQTQAHPARLVLEVTEGLMIDRFDAVIEKMGQLAAVGVGFSIDDFGTGYSSLSYLRRLPISEIKVDRDFVLDAPTDSMDAEIVAMINNLGEFIGLRVVAEGVETQAHAQFLSARFPNMHQQGFFYARPIPATQWLEQLSAQSSVQSSVKSSDPP